MRRCSICWFLAGALLLLPPADRSWSILQTQPVRVSDNGRYLLNDGDTPFFRLGDTAWELLHHLKREEADFHLQRRAARGFTVIQAVVLAEFDGPTSPNPYGQTSLLGSDPSKPNEAYFKHVDYIGEKARSLGLCLGMLPTWGDKFNSQWGVGPEIFTPECGPTGSFPVSGTATVR